MADYDDLPYIVIERGGSGSTSSFLWGALLGAGVAFLLAPRGGRATQAEIRRGAERLRTDAENRVDGAKRAVTGVWERAVERVASVRDSLETRSDQAREAVDAGRHAAREAREQLERRVAQAKAEQERARSGPDAEVVITEVIVEEDPGQIPLG